LKSFSQNCSYVNTIINTRLINDNPVPDPS